MVHKIDKIVKKSGQRENEGRRNCQRGACCPLWTLVSCAARHNGPLLPLLQLIAAAPMGYLKKTNAK